jgi:shikimate kinase
MIKLENISSDKVFLVGFMGCGKTTLGRRLATNFNWGFIDLDEYIEFKEGMSVYDIFKKRGEDYFREVESKALKEFEQLSNVIVSCGGGTACFNDNMKLINSMGTSVYMKLSTEDLAMRLAMDRKDRPLVAELSDNDLYTYVSLELPQREEFYYRADIILNG